MVGYACLSTLVKYYTSLLMFFFNFLPFFVFFPSSFSRMMILFQLIQLMSPPVQSVLKTLNITKSSDHCHAGISLPLFLPLHNSSCFCYDVVLPTNNVLCHSKQSWSKSIILNSLSLSLSPFPLLSSLSSSSFKCSHEFHKKCIDPWLQSKGNCPLCKLSILKRQVSTQHAHSLFHSLSPVVSP